VAFSHTSSPAINDNLCHISVQIYGCTTQMKLLQMLHNCQETVHCKALHSWNNCQRTFKIIGNGAIQDCWYGLTVLDHCNYDSLLILHTWQTVTFTSPSTYNHTLTDNHTQLNRWYILQDIVLVKTFNTCSQNDLQGHSRSSKVGQFRFNKNEF